MIDVISSGLRKNPTGRGTLLHHSTRAMNIDFSGSVVTLLNKEGVLTPSSVVLNVDLMPRIKWALFEGERFRSDQFTFRAGGDVVDLKLHTDGKLNVSFARQVLSKYVVMKERSIINALIAIESGLGTMPENDLERVVLNGEIEAIRLSSSLPELTDRLLGVGFGLTPSGDDFLLGVIAILTACGKSVDDIGVRIAGYDNSFSRTLLKNSVEGYFPSPLLSVLNSLVNERTSDKEMEILLHTGHTSGYDVLAGMIYALNMLQE